ncbi:MAG: HisA/HisF-related TIM barrel protein, partial [Cyclobacteriaceae bacterium]|nr:HisA/HisF-related TIM barrel protein [Cyclobacteriaceae bacterium]
KTIYLDAGSGGHPISGRMISEVHKTIDIPLMVGGGINSVEKARSAFESGADVIVIGNAAEKNPDFLIGVSELVTSLNKRLDVH